jgi:SNF2 family DNA or RNA helicase
VALHTLDTSAQLIKRYFEDTSEVELPSEHKKVLLKDTKLKDYQETGITWLHRCHAAGLNSILGDEMGLGKTLQTLAFLATLPFVSESKTRHRPHVIVSPKSVSHHWLEQRAKFIVPQKFRICDMTCSEGREVRICSATRDVESAFCLYVKSFAD